MIVFGFFGTLLGDPKVLMYFALYFIVVAFVVFTMLERIFALRVILFIANLCRGEKSTRGATTETEDDFERSTEMNDDALAPIVQVFVMFSTHIIYHSFIFYGIGYQGYKQPSCFVLL